MKVLNLLSAIFLICITANAQNDSSFIHGKIPVDAKRWYQLNNVSNGLEQLFDGELYVRPGTGWGKILSNYDSYYPALDGEYISLDSIKMFDWEGVISNYPVTISVITGTGQHITVATFTGERYNGWDGPYPDRPDVFALDSSIHDVRYIVLNAWYEYPTEIEFYGTYKAPDPVSPVVKKPVKLKDFFGINAFEWDLENPVDPMVSDENRMNAVKNFSMVRHYMDWEKPEGPHECQILSHWQRHCRR